MAQPTIDSIAEPILDDELLDGAGTIPGKFPSLEAQVVSVDLSASRNRDDRRKERPRARRSPRATGYRAPRRRRPYRRRTSGTDRQAPPFRSWSSNPELADRLLVARLHVGKREVLIDLQALLARVSRDQLNL